MNDEFKKYNHKCKFCGANYSSHKEKLTQFTCLDCGKRNNIKDMIRQKQIDNNIPTNDIDDFSDLISDTPQDIKFKVEATKVEFNNTADVNSENNSPHPPFNTATENKPTNEAPTLKQSRPRKGQQEERKSNVWKPETFKRFFSMTDRVMVKKSSKELWNITEEEEQELGELWSDVANAYAPNADAKEIKLIVAVGATVAIYVPPTLAVVNAHLQKKKNKKEKKDEAIETTATETEPEIIVEMKTTKKEDGATQSSIDKFAETWKNKKMG